MKNIDRPEKDCAPVTVIIPAYNVESCLKRAVLSALDQSPPPLEVIVINDGSTDGTADVAQRFGGRIRYLEQSNQGPAAARNAGLAAAKGEYVAFLDADDYWLSGFIKTTVEFLETNPEAVAVSTGWKIQPFWGPVKAIPMATEKNNFPRHACVVKNFFNFWSRHDHVRTGTVLLRRSMIDENSFQRTDLRICEDLEFWGYLATLGPWGFIPKALWFGDSARVAAQGGWLKKYRIRRQLCPTLESWQCRILPRLKESDLPGFKKIRGRVAVSYVQNMILGGMLQEARHIVTKYGSEMPDSRISRLMKLGNRCGWVGWKISCGILCLREYQKSIAQAEKFRLSESKR